ncbi:MAG: MotA/TolQ/ExbB proton channel family protein [Candidatus Omnitrophica bacterium]|nr:MotA/TolQ/ExbB proton channel family protein [Candidatus Omnitrophota bacterium]
MPATDLQVILHAGWVIKGILLILAVFSIISWAIILQKYVHLSTAARQSRALVETFGSGGDLRALVPQASQLPASPLANLLLAVVPTSGAVQWDELGRLLQRHTTVETEKLYRYLTFLATTGSTAPFIGLLGTVWGIMTAFQQIGSAGSASLAVVAPGIAEALITTAAGLAAAIPAVIAYNYYLSWARRLTVELDGFADHLKQLIVKQFP